MHGCVARAEAKIQELLKTAAAGLQEHAKVGDSPLISTLDAAASQVSPLEQIVHDVQAKLTRRVKDTRCRADKRAREIAERALTDKVDNLVQGLQECITTKLREMNVDDAIASDSSQPLSPSSAPASPATPEPPVKFESRGGRADHSFRYTHKPRCVSAASFAS